MVTTHHRRAAFTRALLWGGYLAVLLWLNPVRALAQVVILQQPQSTNVIQGGSATFSVTVANSAPIYQWLKLTGGATDIPGATNASVTLTNVQPAHQGEYSVYIYADGAGAYSAPATLTVIQPPSITPPFPPTLATNAGSFLFLPTGVGGTPPFVYEWSFNGVPLPAFTNANLLITDAQAQHSGTYSILVTNAAGFATASIAVTVTDIKPVITTQPVNRSVAGGTNTSFTVAASGTTPIGYQWWRNGAPLPGATATTLAIPFVTVADAGTYFAAVTNALGTTNSNTVRLSVFVHPNLLWVRTGGGARNDGATAVALGTDARPHIAGLLASNALFGASNVAVALGNTNQVFLAQYDPAGTLLAVGSFAGPQSDQINALAVDAASNRVVAGQFRGTLDFGVTNLTSTGSNDVFLAKIAPDGTALWARRFGGTRDDIARGVAVDAAGDIIVTGYFQGAMTNAGLNLTSAPVTVDDVFLAKFSAAGDLVWARNDGGTSQDRGHAVATDSTGNIFVTGHFNQTAAFGSTNLVASNTTSKAFVCKYGPAGSVVWAVRVRSLGQDSGLGIAVDATGYSWLTGEFGRNDYGAMRLFKYDPVGAELWWTNVGVSCCTGDYIRGNAVAVDSAGRSYVVGNSTASANIAGVSLGLGGYAAAFDENGRALWARRIGREPSGVAVDAQTNVYVTGVFTNTFNFGSGVISGVTSRGSNDVFLAKLAVLPPQLTEPLTDQFLPMDSALGLRASAVSSGGLLYQWQFNGADIAGATNAALTFTNALASAGSYTLVLRSALGTITNGPIAVSAFRFNWETNRSTFEVAGPVGANYRIEHCDLPDTNWFTLTNLTIVTNPEAAADSSVGTTTNRIYRLVR